MKDTIIRVSLLYLGSSIYCSLHFQMQTITNMYDETNFSRSFIALLTHGLCRLLKLLFQKSHNYQVHFIKICTEIGHYSGCYMLYYYYFCIKFCIVITVFAVTKVILDTSERNFQRSFDSSFLSGKYQYLEEFLYEKFPHQKIKEGILNKSNPGNVILS